ncbi:TetR family transcriptional regulator [Planotetraspora silvatica]|uniref:TetR family transcriptional regulator n=1 Tax=Planotetraspora silvatica TaxID=234614 RepID=A0A8J3XQD5_9ACTN|nr:TetR family transcriptional regulator [Planotetraspora silvatica]
MSNERSINYCERVVTRDPDTKKRNLLDAALAEFAARGIAATRTDAIAARAGCSPGLIYTYFGSKEGLFDAVFDRIVTETVTEIPITPDDLPGYAGRLFDGHAKNPDIARIVAWHSLERGGSGDRIASSDEAGLHKIDAIRAAQATGTVTTRFDAEQLVFLVQGIALAWTFLPDEVTDLVADPTDLARRRSTVVDAVRRLVQVP